jgi:tetratricopeptide (TPR) repeat protein
VHLGDVDAVRGRWSAAARAYEEAMRRDPQSIDAHRALALAYARAGRPAEAIRQYRRLLALAPRDAGGHRDLATLLAAAGEIPGALAHARRALELAGAADRPAIEQLVARLRAAAP